MKRQAELGGAHWGLRRSTESGAQSFPMEGKWWSNDTANSGLSTAVARTRSVTTSTSHWRRQSTPKPFRHNTRIRFTTPPGFDAWQTNSRKSRSNRRSSLSRHKSLAPVDESCAARAGSVRRMSSRSRRPARRRSCKAADHEAEEVLFGQEIVQNLERVPVVYVLWHLATPPKLIEG